MLKNFKKIAKSILRFLKGPRLRRADLVRAFARLGVQSGDLLLVHASMSALGYVAGGEKAVVAALREVLGEKGTLLLPTHSWEQVNAGLRRFDACLTTSCVGRLSEFFRLLPGSIRSLHPTHSVAASGPQASALTSGHEKAQTPCGEGTPYHRLLEMGGRILMLGVGLESNTSFHTMEALTGFAHLMEPQKIDFELVDQNGRESRRAFALHLEGVRRCYPAMETTLIQEGVMKEGRVGAARCLLINGRAFLKLMSSMLASNPILLMADPEQKIPLPRTK